MRVTILFSSIVFIFFNYNLISFGESVKTFETNSMHLNVEIKSREKRFLRYNSFSALYIGILLGIPITTALPIVGQDLLYSNEFNHGLLREERSTEEEFEDHRIVEPFLRKLTSYFDLLKMNENKCQIRAICEFSANPEKFYPISDLFLNKINVNVPQGIYKDPEGLNSTNKRSLFSVFSTAANDGIALGEKGCLEKYGTCRISLDKRMNMGVLGFWKFLSSIIDFSLDDDIL